MNNVTSEVTIINQHFIVRLSKDIKSEMSIITFISVIVSVTFVTNFKKLVGALIF